MRVHYTQKVNKRQYTRTPLILRSVGIDHEQNAIHRPKGFPTWQILYGVSGRGEFVVDGSRGVLAPGQIALLYPGGSHRYESLGERWTVHYLCFDGQLCQKLLSVLRLNSSGIYSLSAPDVFLDHLSRLEDRMAGNSPARLTDCSKELYALLMDLALSVKRLPDSRIREASGLEREMILYLEEHYAADLSLNDLSIQFERTPEYLCAVFKTATGETIMQYLRRVRLHHAKVLLLTAPDKHLREVASNCGFHSLSYFCKVFREATGFTPQSFRLGIAERE